MTATPLTDLTCATGALGAPPNGVLTPSPPPGSDVGIGAASGAALSHGRGLLGWWRSRVGPARDRGDVPGWVLVTLMTAGLVITLWAVAGPALSRVFTDAISSVTGPGNP